jgi:cell division protein FtsB
LVGLLQNGERASHVLTQLNNENEELKHRNRETNRQIKHLSTDYCNLISKLSFQEKYHVLIDLIRYNNGISRNITTSYCRKNNYE